MMKYIKKLISKLSARLGGDKKAAVVMVIGIIGVITLVVSEFLPEKKKPEEYKQNEEPCVQGTYDYEKNIEDRLCSLISQIQGAGKVKVMVTLEKSDQNIYAFEEVQHNGDNPQYENRFVIIKKEDGEQGVLVSTAQPEIRGVAVVCTGGSSAVVRQNITNTLTAVLGISAARVSITEMKTDNGG